MFHSLLGAKIKAFYQEILDVYYLENLVMFKYLFLFNVVFFYQGNGPHWKTSEGVKLAQHLLNQIQEICSVSTQTYE